MESSMRNLKIGLALGGGGARGGIHIGVLKVLEEHQIPVHCIAGTSIGALLGGLYSLTLDARAVEKRLFDYLKSEVFGEARFSFLSGTPSEDRDRLFSRISSFVKKEYILNVALSRPCIYRRKHFLETLSFFLKDMRIEETLIPFAAVATDLESGEEVILCTGSLLDAVYASITYPGVVEAVRLDGRLLVDGGVTSLIPVAAARKLGADLVIAVNPEPPISARIESLCGIEVLFRADDIMGAELAAVKSKEADVLIFPGEGEAKWYEFEKAPEYISIGEKAAEEKIPEIRRLMKPGLFKRILKGFHPCT
jgi:NTE family protein